MGLTTYLYRGYNPFTKYHGHPSSGLSGILVLLHVVMACCGGSFELKQLSFPVRFDYLFLFFWVMRKGLFEWQLARRNWCWWNSDSFAEKYVAILLLVLLPVFFKNGGLVQKLQESADMAAILGKQRGPRINITSIHWKLFLKASPGSKSLSDWKLRFGALKIPKWKKLEFRRFREKKTHVWLVFVDILLPFISFKQLKHDRFVFSIFWTASFWHISQVSQRCGDEAN